MIQVRFEFENIYIKILDQYGSFDRDLEKLRSLPDRAYNKSTNEWIVPRKVIPDILRLFDTQITWVDSLSRIVEGLPIQSDLLSKHLAWESDKSFSDFKCALYPYQKIGANFLIDKKRAAVFDGCGLGKTPILIAAASRILQQNPKTKALIVTLSSLKKQWEREVSKFTSMTAIAASGLSSARTKTLREFSKSKNQFLIINYEMLRNHSYLEILKSIPFSVVGLDEAQKIKTGVTDKKLRMKPSQNAAGTYELSHIPNRFIATATPVQGKAEEIFSLFQFLDPEILGSWDYFKEKYCKTHPKYGITGYKDLTNLYSLISPYFIRRTKNMPEIQQQLPKIQHAHIFLEMQPQQERVHAYLLEQIEEIKEKSRSISGYQTIHGSPMSPEEQKDHYDQLMQAYQIFLIAACDDLNLFLKSDSSLASKVVKSCEITGQSLVSPKLNHLGEFYEAMAEDSPDSKLVVFTRFERMAKIIADFLPGSVLFTGKMHATARDHAVEMFRNDPNVRCFVSTDAGSTGLNLQVANYMVHFDLPWDPTLIEQRNGRIDRTGSEFSNVTIYYYIMSESFDEQLLKIIFKKSELASQVVTGSVQDQSSGANPNQLAIESLIRQKEKRNH